MFLPDRGRGIRLYRSIMAATVLFLVSSGRCPAFDTVDLVSGVLDSPQFRDKDPVQKLRMASDLLRSDKLKHADLAFALLDWGDQYVREPSDPLERLKRWQELTNDEKLSRLKIPRDFLNRMLLAEYLVNVPTYLKASPEQKLEFLGKLEEKNLVDWSVSLAYARLYAGAILSGAKSGEPPPPLEALTLLKKLKDHGLVNWHYRVPTEAILVAEALALDREFQKATPYDRLVRLRELERQGLITSLTRKELEKLPAWRLLVTDPSFLKSDPDVKRERLAKLKADGLLLSSTFSDLNGIFRPSQPLSTLDATPAPRPQKTAPRGKLQEPLDSLQKP
jgi:hypothetical protein